MVPETSVHKSLVVNSKASVAKSICEQILSEIKARHFDEQDIFAIHLAIEEALVNAIKHGNKHDQSKQITIEYTITPKNFEISISDSGEGFQPDVVPDPRSKKNLYKSSGRGMLLMRSFMDVVEYNDVGNCVRMEKNRSDAKAKAGKAVELSP